MKVKSLILKVNPATQRFNALKLGTFSGIVSKIIHKNLKLKIMFEPKKSSGFAKAYCWKQIVEYYTKKTQVLKNGILW